MWCLSLRAFLNLSQIMDHLHDHLYLKQVLTNSVAGLFYCVSKYLGTALLARLQVVVSLSTPLFTIGRSLFSCARQSGLFVCMASMLNFSALHHQSHSWKSCREKSSTFSALPKQCYLDKQVSKERLLVFRYGMNEPFTTARKRDISLPHSPNEHSLLLDYLTGDNGKFE